MSFSSLFFPFSSFVTSNIQLNIVNLTVLPILILVTVLKIIKELISL